MALFDIGELKEFLLLFCNFKMTLVESKILEAEPKLRYLRTLVCGEALCQIDLLLAVVKGINP